jgi:DNA-binding PadR family transcriptional regulator
MATAQTELAILGALSVEPMTGYELRKNINEVLGHFWSESFGQIYPTLARLVDEGLVKTSHESTTGKTHVITRSGLTRLRALLRQPIQDRPPRSSTMLRLFFGRHLSNNDCLDLVLETRTRAINVLNHLAAVRRDLENNPTADSPYFLMTVDLGEEQAKATQRWAERTIRLLEAQR